MKQPKLMVGQVWHCSLNEADVTAMRFIKNGIIEWSDGENNDLEWTNRFMAFVPQNDLEWLAVNVDKWYCAADYLRKGSGVPFICNADHPDAISREQHRNERYRLGLDTKPHYEFINGQWGETK